jgi:SAM-dependent methyltransferase
VDEAPHLTPGPFDLVFATWGTLCWLPDMRDWARVIAAVLAPGGELYCADAHPAFVTLEEHAGRLSPTFDFQTPRDRLLGLRAATYGRSDRNDTSIDSGVDTFTVRDPRCAIDAGLTITMFQHEVLPWRREAARVTSRPGETFALSGDVQSLVPAPDRMWRLPDGHPRIPLSFSVRAKKGA